MPGLVCPPRSTVPNRPISSSWTHSSGSTIEAMPIYGIDIGRLGDLVGTVPPNHNAPVLSLITRPEYTLEQIVLGSAGEHETCTAPSESATVFGEEGTIQRWEEQTTGLEAPMYVG